jgi:hypothetical protein
MIGHLLLSLVLAGGAIAILVAGLRLRPGRPVWAMFVVLFLGIWAGGMWMTPIGPTHFGVTWLPFLLIAILLAVLVVVLNPQARRTQRAEIELEREVVVGLGLFFWVLTGALAMAIVAGYR